MGAVTSGRSKNYDGDVQSDTVALGGLGRLAGPDDAGADDGRRQDSRAEAAHWHRQIRHYWQYQAGKPTSTNPIDLCLDPRITASRRLMALPKSSIPPTS